MANNKSIYDVYFEAGEAEGEYGASLSELGNIWSGIEFSRGDLAFDLERIGRTVDTLQAATELGATVAGGIESRKEFETKDLTATQSEIARQSYEKQKAEGAPSWDELDRNERADIMANYTPTEVGAGGKLWSEYSTLEKMWEKPLYRFGGEDVGHAYAKSDVQGISQFSKYGTPKLDVFQTSLYGEATNQNIPVSPGSTQPTKYETLETTTEAIDQMSGEPVYNQPPRVKESKKPVEQSEVGPYKGGYKYPKKKNEIDFTKPYTLNTIYK